MAYDILYVKKVSATTATVNLNDSERVAVNYEVTLYDNGKTTILQKTTTNENGDAVFTGLTPNTNYYAYYSAAGYVNIRTLNDGSITATEGQWEDLINKVKTLQTGKVNAKKIQGSTSGVVYRKVTVVGGSSVYDGVGILLFSREQRYLIDGMTASWYSGRCIEMGTNNNGTTATTDNRVINLKVYGVPESSRVEIYCRMSPYVYIDVHSTGAITIENSTESDYNNATDNSVHKSFLNRGDSIPETDVIWDGNTVKKDGELSPATMGCLDEFGHNRLAFLPAECLSFAFSRDGGTTWLDYTTANGADFTPTNAQKIQFVTYGNVWFAAGGRIQNNSSTVANERLRIRVAAWKNKTGTQAIYGQLKQLILNMTSEGSSGTQVTIRYRTLANFRDNVETWVTYGSGYGLSGWSGWNSIPYRRRFGGSSTQTGQDGEIELVFWQTGVNSSTKRNMKVGALRAISSNLWNSPSDMASTGRLYSIDTGKHATFPGNIINSDTYSYNLFRRNSTSWGNIGSSTTPWEAIYLNDGIYNGNVHLNLPSSEGTLALNSEIKDGTLTIQKNGATVNTFSANAASNKTVNITVPTTAADVSALPSSTKYGSSLIMSLDQTNYKVTVTLKDQDGNTLGTAQTIDLPIENVVVSGSYDAQNKKIILTLENGNTVEFSVADLVAGLQNEITSTNKLPADLVDDTNTTHKFVTASEKTTWNNKQNAMSAGEGISIANNTITNRSNLTFYGTSDTAAGTAAKVVTCSSFTSADLVTGTRIIVKFTNANSYSGQATLNINSTGSKNIYYNGTTTNAQYMWVAGESVEFVYNGSQWAMVNGGLATTTYYGVTKLSSATNSTSTSLAATPSAVKSAYDLANGKQDKLTAGAGITIADNVISASGTSYTAGDNITISNNTIDTASTVPLIGATVSEQSSVAYVNTNNIVDQAITPAKLAAAVMDMIYPVGSIYMSATLSTAAQVEAIFGGTWVAWGAGRVPVGMGNNGTTNYTTVEATGGSERHSHSPGSMTACIGSPSGNANALGFAACGPDGPQSTYSVGNATSAQTNGHPSRSHNTLLTGVTEYVSSLQPYITCYMYKRTA